MLAGHQIIVPGVRQRYHLGEFLTTRDRTTSWNAWYKFAKPVRRSTASIVTIDQSLIRSHCVEPSSLERLPIELLTLIIQIPGLRKQDVISLGASSSFLWAFVLEFIRKQCELTSGAWAGHPVACVSNEVIEDGSNRISCLDLRVDSLLEYSHVARPCLWYNVRDLSWCRGMGDEDGPLAWELAFAKAIENRTAIAKAHIKSLRVSLLSAASYAPLLSPKERWILRDLANKEYIRCCPSSGEQTAHVDHPDINHIILDDVLILRICAVDSGWSKSRYSTATKQWAGHSFDIVPVQNVSLSIDSGWKDVTDEAALDVQRLFKGKQGLLGVGSNRPEHFVARTKTGLQTFLDSVTAARSVS